jgi:hypothetical protein
VKPPTQQQPTFKESPLPVKPIVASTPAPFQPIKYEEEKSDDSFSADEYLPPLDVRTDDLSDWDLWKVSLCFFTFSF